MSLFSPRYEAKKVFQIFNFYDLLFYVLISVGKYIPMPLVFFKDHVPPTELACEYTGKKTKIKFSKIGILKKVLKREM